MQLFESFNFFPIQHRGGKSRAVSDWTTKKTYRWMTLLARKGVQFDIKTTTLIQSHLDYRQRTSPQPLLFYLDTAAGLLLHAFSSAAALIASVDAEPLRPEEATPPDWYSKKKAKWCSTGQRKVIKSCSLDSAPSLRNFQQRIRTEVSQRNKHTSLIVAC